MGKNNVPTRFRVALFDSDVAPYTVTADTENQHEICSKDPRFIRWVTGWQHTNQPPKRKDEPTLASYGLEMETCTLRLNDLEYSYELRFIGGIPFAGKTSSSRR